MARSVRLLYPFLTLRPPSLWTLVETPLSLDGGKRHQDTLPYLPSFGAEMSTLTNSAIRQRHCEGVRAFPSATRVPIWVRLPSPELEVRVGVEERLCEGRNAMYMFEVRSRRWGFEREECFLPGKAFCRRHKVTLHELIFAQLRNMHL